MLLTYGAVVPISIVTAKTGGPSRIIMTNLVIRALGDVGSTLVNILKQ